MTLAETIRDRVTAAIRARHRGAAPPPPPDNSAVEFRELPLSATALRTVCVECTTCWTPVLRESTAAHAAEHVRVMLAAAGGMPATGSVIASDGVESPA